MCGRFCGKSAASSLQYATGFMDKWVINLRQNLREDGHIEFNVKIDCRNGNQPTEHIRGN